VLLRDFGATSAKITKRYQRESRSILSILGQKKPSNTQQGDYPNFEIADEMKKGVGGAIVDALVLEPNFAGVGINLNHIIDFFRGRQQGRKT
jgi:hypothetical protein